MTQQADPIKNNAAGWITYVSLAPRTPSGIWQANPTLATGDVKISLDGGALANLGTLPAVTPASSKLVKITLSQAETNADNLTIIFSDAAGAEWTDLTLNVQTRARGIEDLATPTNITAGVITTVTNLTNAPTNGDLTATMKTSVTTAVPTAAVNAAATWDLDATAHQTQGTFGQAIGDPVADANTIYGAVVTGAAGATVAADIIAMKVDTAAILDDTDDIGVAGAGLTALATQASVDAIDNFLDTEIGAPSDLGSGASLAKNLLDMAGATFAGATDSQEAIRNRGDAAWVTATGFATSGALTTAQNDLDLLTGTDGATLATLQGNYAPSKAGDAMALTSTYDFAKGTVAMTESYAANAAAPTPVQALFALHQDAMQFAISGTSKTVKKLDNVTTAFVGTLDDGTSPTSLVRT